MLNVMAAEEHQQVAQRTAGTEDTVQVQRL